jgi:hypothetical protein
MKKEKLRRKWMPKGIHFHLDHALTSSIAQYSNGASQASLKSSVVVVVYSHQWQLFFIEFCITKTDLSIINTYFAFGL